MKKIFSINNIIYYLAITILVVILILLLTGHKLYYVKTSSMDPEIPQWSLICDKVYKDKSDFYNDITIGTDITFRTNNGTVVTHRIIFIDKENDLITTQGIKGNSVIDDSISFSQVLGVVTISIPFLGFIVMLCQTWYFWVLLLCLIISYYILKELIKIKKQKK